MSILAAAAALAIQEGQPAPEAVRGREFVREIGRAWSDQAPFKAVFGLYHGRLWKGAAELEVSRAPGRTDGALSVRMKLHYQAVQDARDVLAEGLLAADLIPLEWKSSERIGGNEKISTIRTASGEWKFTSTKNDEKEEKSGRAEPGFVASEIVVLLPFFLVPTQSITLSEVEQEDAFRRPEKPQRIRMSQGFQEVPCVELADSGGGRVLYVLDDKNRVREARVPDLGLRIRRVTEEARGKNLEESLEYTPAEQAVVEFFRAVKAGSRERIEKVVDFARMTESVMPGLKDRPEKERQAIVELMRAKMLASWLENKEVAASLPAEEEMGDSLWGIMETRQEAERTVVRMGEWDYTLYEADGAWRISGIRVASK